MKAFAVILLSVAICQGAVYRRESRPAEETGKEPVNRDADILNRAFWAEEYSPYKEEPFVFYTNPDKYEPYRDVELSTTYRKYEPKKGLDRNEPESEKELRRQLKETEQLKRERKPLEEIEKIERSIFQNENPNTRRHKYIESIVQQELYEKNHANISSLFPTGKMLLNMIIEQYPWYKTLEKDYIKDFEGLDEAFLTELVGSVPEIRKTIKDPTTLAVIYSKVVLKEVVEERLKCPSAVLDKLLMRRVKETLKVLLVENYNKNFNSLKQSLSKVVEGQEAEKLARAGALDMDDEVFYHVLHFIASRQLEDLEHLSNKVFAKFTKFFEKYPKTDIKDIVSIIQTSIEECGVKCPAGNIQKEIAKYAFWEIAHPFIPMAAQSLAFRVERMLYRQLYYSFVSKGEEIPNQIYSYISRQMHPVLLDLAKKFYEDCTRPIEDYEQAVISRKASSYIRVIQPFIKPEEKDVVVYALKKLGWEVPENQSYEQRLERGPIGQADGGVVKLGKL